MSACDQWFINMIACMTDMHAVGTDLGPVDCI